MNIPKCAYRNVITFRWGPQFDSTTTLKTGPWSMMSNAIKDLSVSSSSPVRFEVKWHSSWSDKWYQSQGHEFKSQSVIVREGLLGDHNLTLYNHSKNRSALCDVECHKRFECVFLITNWFWGGMTQLMVRHLSYWIYQNVSIDRKYALWMNMGLLTENVLIE